MNELHKSAKIRILHVSATSTGGVGLNLLLLAKYLDRERFELSFAMPQDSHFYDAIAREGVTVHPLPISRNPFRSANLRAGWKLYKIIRGGHYDLVHTHTSVGGFVGRVVAKLAGCRHILWSIHGWSFNYPGRGEIKKVIFKSIERMLDPITDRYVAVCDNMRQVGLTAAITTPSKISVIYHGLDLAAYPLPDTDNVAIAAKKEHGLDSDTVTIGTIGRFEPQKAMDDFLRAAALVSQTHSGARFVLVGDGPQKEYLQTLAAELGLQECVIFLPWTQNVKEVLLWLDVICLSSHWEAMPFMLIEAMAMGKPVVSTTVGGIPEVVEEGQNGKLVAPGDCRGLAEAIGALVADGGLRRDMAARNRAKIGQQFTIAKMMDSYKSIYEVIVQDA